MASKIRSGDTVQVMSGKDAGNQGHEHRCRQAGGRRPQQDPPPDGSTHGSASGLEENESEEHREADEQPLGVALTDVLVHPHQR